MDAVRGFAIPFRVGRGGGVAVEEGPEKLRDNVVHILLTGLGERAMRRGYGAGLRQILHDPVNDALLSVVQHQVLKSLAEAEPRVEVIDVRIRAHRHGGANSDSAGTLGAEPPGDAVIAEVEFRVRTSGQPVAVSVPVALGGA